LNVHRRSRKPLQLRDRVAIQKVFPLQDGVRVHRRDAVDKAIDERLILGAANAAMPRAGV